MTRDKVEQTIEYLDSNQVIRKNKIINNWYSIYCPFHNDGNEKKASFGVNLISTYANVPSSFTCVYLI